MHGLKKSAETPGGTLSEILEEIRRNRLKKIEELFNTSGEIYNTEPHSCSIMFENLCYLY